MAAVMRRGGIECGSIRPGESLRCLKPGIERDLTDTAVGGVQLMRRPLQQQSSRKLGGRLSHQGAERAVEVIGRKSGPVRQIPIGRRVVQILYDGPDRFAHPMQPFRFGGLLHSSILPRLILPIPDLDCGF